MLTDVADEDFFDKTGGGGGGLYSARFTRRSQPTLSQRTEANFTSQLWYQFSQEVEGSKEITPKKELSRYSNCDGDPIGPTEPEDFAAKATGTLDYEDYFNEVRIRYIMGIQWMIQLQCEALVENFGVSPLICGIASAVWLRLVVVAGVFKDGWANATLTESEIQNRGTSSSLMFRPSQPVPFQKLEAMAASIAELIGLSLPPVNFYAVASSFLNQLDTGYLSDEMPDSGEKMVINERVVQGLKFDSGELLRNLESKYSEIGEPCEFAKDLPSYLQYCNDVVFAGGGSSSQDQREEEELIEKLWNYYQNAKVTHSLDLARVHLSNSFLVINRTT
ncbi:unnamed protein product [Linum tenue]|uniref:Rab3 GTPase-activating protein catalytic subunit n=2 Tax=Linum tenue TaxID=586396 RepID=A0AAV0KY02_9ROSI|nr:unnamed protein product [Linum tenue]